MKKNYISAQIEVRNVNESDVNSTSVSFQVSGFGKTLDWDEIGL